MDSPSARSWWLNRRGPTLGVAGADAGYFNPSGATCPEPAICPGSGPFARAAPAMHGKGQARRSGYGQSRHSPPVHAKLARSRRLSAVRAAWRATRISHLPSVVIENPNIYLTEAMRVPLKFYEGKARAAAGGEFGVARHGPGAVVAQLA